MQTGWASLAQQAQVLIGQEIQAAKRSAAVLGALIPTSGAALCWLSLGSFWRLTGRLPESSAALGIGGGFSLLCVFLFGIRRRDTTLLKTWRSFKPWIGGSDFMEARKFDVAETAKKVTDTLNDGERIKGALNDGERFVKEGVNATKDSLRKELEPVMDFVEESAEKVTKLLKENTQEIMQEIEHLGTTVTDYTRKHPFMTIACSLAVGASLVAAPLVFAKFTHKNA